MLKAENQTDEPMGQNFDDGHILTPPCTHSTIITRMLSQFVVVVTRQEQQYIAIANPMAAVQAVHIPYSFVASYWAIHVLREIGL